MRNDVDKIKAAILDIKRMRIKNIPDFVSTVQQLNKKFNYDIPFKTIEEFKAFNNHLSEKKDLRESVVIYIYILDCFYLTFGYYQFNKSFFQMNVLQSGLDPQMVISKSMVTMLKMFLSKKLAMQCVAVRNIQDKVPIKSTPFCECIKG